MQSPKRLVWLDVARALAMIFVILGHISNELNAAGYASDAFLPLLLKFLNTVKLPLFFTISGYLFSKKNDDPHSFFSRQFRSRLIPYIIWGSFMGLIAFAMDLLRSRASAPSILSLLLENYLVPFLRGNLVWYIPCLLIAELLFWGLLQLSHKDPAVLVLLTLVCTTAGYLLSSDHIVKPWKIDTALTCTQFLTFGYLLRNVLEPHFTRGTPRQRLLGSGIAYFLLVVPCLLCWPNLYVDLNMGTYFQPAAFSLLSMVGILAVFNLCQCLPAWPPLVFIGQNTLLYFVLHMYFVKIVLAVLRHIPAFSTLPTTLTALLILLVSCCGVAVVCRFVNRFLWFTVGKNKPDNCSASRCRA